jgi:hypothetical protein
LAVELDARVSYPAQAAAAAGNPPIRLIAGMLGSRS